MPYVGLAAPNVNSKASNSSIALTVDHTIPAGNLVLVYFSIDDGRVYVEPKPTIVDAKGNVWTQLERGGGYTAGWAEEGSGSMVWGSYIGVPLVSGDTITVSYPTTAVTKLLTADEFSGVALRGWVKPSGVVDIDTLPHTWTKPPFAYAWTEHDPNGLLVALITITGPSTDGFTNDPDSTGGDTWHAITYGTTGGNDITQRRAYKFLVNNAVSQDYSPTLGTSRGWIAQGPFGFDMTAAAKRDNYEAEWYAANTCQDRNHNHFETRLDDPSHLPPRWLG